MRDSALGSRSETVRRRRKRDGTQRLNDSPALARRPVAPITTRHSALPAAPPRERRPVRRRREAALTIPGIEVHLPTISFSGSGAKWRFVSFSLSLLLGGTLYLASTAETFLAGAPQIVGNERIPSEEISSVLAIGHSQIFWLIPSQLEGRLRLNLPELVDARVRVSLPNKVEVEVRERTPVIAWYQEEAYTWIDATGVAFRPRGSADNVITVQAQNAPGGDTTATSDPLTPRPFIAADLLEAILTLAPHAPPGAAITYDERYGLGWTDGRGWQVYFGDQSRDMALKLRVYESMVQMVSAQGIQPEFINVQYPGAPYYRMAE